ncbi:unnamed protein product [Urochloa humidicola]
MSTCVEPQHHVCTPCGPVTRALGEATIEHLEITEFGFQERLPSSAVVARHHHRPFAACYKEFPICRRMHDRKSITISGHPCEMLTPIPHRRAPEIAEPWNSTGSHRDR